jgi:hypothetical protein
LLLLDRGFYSVSVIRYLYRGRAAHDSRGPSSTNIFAKLKCSGWHSYTLTAADQQTATVPMCVHCRNWQGRRRRHGRQTLVMPVGGIGQRSTHWVYQTYRQRFRTETTYRQLNQARLGVAAR